MSRIFLLFTTIFMGIFGGLFAVDPVSDKPCPMPLYQGSMNFPSAEVALPEPHREEAVRKWLIPSVRIRVPGAAGSGTICHYDRSKNIAYVISCAHLFRQGDSSAVIEVFYKNEEKLPSPQRYNAKVLSFKVGYWGDDISFMSFQPDWIPQTWFPIAPENHVVLKDERYYSCGCDGASEVACYYVKPQGIDGSFLATRENSPRPGRSGGGLMDKDGWYVGICVRTSHVDGSGTGFFVHLKTIHDYCRKNNLEFLLNIPLPNNLLRKMPIVDRTGPQGTYPIDYVPVP